MRIEITVRRDAHVSYKPIEDREAHEVYFASSEDKEAHKHQIESVAQGK